MDGDPIPSTSISDATTGGLSVIVITGGSTGQVLTLQANGTYAPATVSAGIGGAVGATDNRLVRSDGTGGSTVQSTGITVDDSNNVSGVTSLQISGSASLPAVLFDGRWSLDPTKRVVQIRVDSSGFGDLSLNRSNDTAGMVWITAAGGIVQVAANGGFYFSDANNSSTGQNASLTLTRNSAGVAQIGTTGANALGSLLLANLTASGLLCAGVYTFATVPSASSNTGKFLRISDRAQKHAYSDGTNWRFFGDDAIIS